MEWKVILIMVLGIIFLIVFLICLWQKQTKAKEQVLNKLNNREEFTPDEFIKMYKNLINNKITINSIDQSGCYVFLNKTKNLNYVGQSKNVLKRINQHLNAKGNGDVYADLKYGDEFNIFIVKCPENELNVTEKILIEEFNAYTKGYNKNAGIGRGF